MKRLLIKNGRVLDPATGLDGDFDIVVMNGTVASIKPTGEKGPGTENGADGGWDIIDAKGKLVVPGLIDIHTHLREPGHEYKETIKTGTAAAVAGGFTIVLCMANTEPVNDCGSVTRYILKKAADEGACKVLPIGAVSVGLLGKELSEMADMVEAGIVAVSDDGEPIVDGSLMRRALEYSRIFNIPVISHAEDPTIALSGVMNEGVVSTRLGLKGIPDAAESAMVARDITLAELTGGRLHIAHVSTKGAVELIRAAKSRGVKVTAEVTPHHLTLDHGAVSEFDTNAKMNPPLRAIDDLLSLIEALNDGTLDTIATDHAPHSTVEKDVEFNMAAFGIVGLETALSLVLSLVNSKDIDLTTAISAMTINPARAAGLEKSGAGTLKVGSPADVTIIDLDKSWTVEPEKFKSKSRNTPFGGRKLKGRVEMTIVDGKIVFTAS
ncbi:MAG: dihydroorotase [Thermodesulfobacteriota bacterium]